MGVEPWVYLRDVRTHLPGPPAGLLGDLLPDHWQATYPAEATPPAVPATDGASMLPRRLPYLDRCIIVIRPYQPFAVTR
jgi:hypothetical protein